MPDYRYLDRRRRHDRRRGVQGDPPSATPIGSIVLVGDEQHAPYARPPLSKGLWNGARRRTRSGARPRSTGSSSGSAARSSRSTRPRTLRPTTSGDAYGYDRAAARDRRAAAAAARRAPTASSTSARSTTTGACASATAGGAQLRRDRRRVHRLGDRGRPRPRPDASVTLVVPRPGDRRAALPRRARARPSTTTTVSAASRCSRARRVDGVDGRRRLHVTTEAGALDADVVVAGLGIVPATELAAAIGPPRRQRHRRRRPRPRRRRATTCSLPATSPVSRLPRSATRRASSTRTTPRPTAAQVGANMAGADEALRPPAVLLLRPVRPRLRGGRRGRLAAADRDGLGRAEPQGRRRLRRRRGPAARVPALGRLGQGRRAPAT